MVNRYKYVNIPEPLLTAIEDYIKKTGHYTTVASFVQEACRIRLEELTKKRMLNSERVS